MTFASGRVYAYQGVPPELCADMRAAFAKGMFFNQRIRGRFDVKPEASDDADG